MTAGKPKNAEQWGLKKCCLGALALLAFLAVGAQAATPVMAPKKDAWEKSVGGREAARHLLKARLSGWPARLVVPREELPQGEREFLERLARDTWRGLRDLSDAGHGLPLDNVGFDGGLEAAAAQIGDYTSVTNVGVHLAAVVAAFELGLVDRAEAQRLTSLTLDTLDRLESYRGFFYNYYDTTSLERTSHFISFVDSAWLTAGLMTARMAFPELAPRCSKFIDRSNYAFFYDKKWKLMRHGYYVDKKRFADAHYGVLYTEARLGSLIAIGKGDAPPEHWFRMIRTFPKRDRWQAMPPQSRRVKRVNGYKVTGGHYRWKDIDFVPSWGGSMFEALMPALLIDEQAHAPQSLGANDQAHATVQRRYATEELGYPVWGMSPSATPGSVRYAEYGVPILGAKGYLPGVVTPHAAALGLLATPQEAAANLLELARRYPLYGEYGLYDAVNPISGAVARKYLVLNQSMILIALANHLKDHAVQRRFAGDPIMQKALPLIGVENFFD
ncbi:MAG TPA: glucoamylase family protein [Methylococcaceae bacterium]|nr:glucoamylase family protein [Methylococcaceae bacterium]